MLSGPRETQLVGDRHEVAQIAPVDIHNSWLSQKILDGDGKPGEGWDLPTERLRAAVDEETQI
ncbi:hypothetical protein GCM10010524_09970 [Streptomyces mexicanus]